MCVENMASCSCVAPLQRAMNMRKDLIEISASMFNGIFKHHHEVIVKQVGSINIKIYSFFQYTTDRL